MPELTPQQQILLERLHAKGFETIVFPLYPNHVGIGKGGCAALLASIPPSGFQIFGAPSFLLDRNLTVRIKDKDGVWFVFKKLRLKATPERLKQLAEFTEELSDLLLPSA